MHVYDVVVFIYRCRFIMIHLQMSDASIEELHPQQSRMIAVSY
jgi:hypothetical protein